MRLSRDRILTSHAGSLPRPTDLIELNRARAAGEPVSDQQYAARLKSATADVVARQKAAGVDVPNDGEYGKSMRQAVDYAAWVTYAHGRLGGLEILQPGGLSPGFATRRDRQIFAEAYNDPDSGITTGRGPRPQAVCVAPLTYSGQAMVQADIENLKAALAANGVEEGFLTAVAPGSVARMGNQYYGTEEEFIFACADAMREEYKAIVDSGLVLQLDDPAIAENWDALNPAPTVEEYRKFSMVRVEALNHAIKGLPEDRIRFHLCWGSWHGPHTTDIAMKDIVDVMLAVNCQGYSFEAGNVRHEHEWRVWQDVKLPDGKVIYPGVVSHATNVVEHPEVVADRIVRFAELVGREHVVAATDCGLGGRIHPQIAWAKLEALAEGAKLATRRLWA